jgi:CDP-glycerol glycerophosphotransferase (TagB/SpsB family)
MISDFSGIIYDYVFLFDRPVLVNIQNLDFRRLDAHNVKQEPYYYQSFKKIGVELDGSKLESIDKTITDLIHNNELRENRSEVKKTLWQYQNEAGKRVVDFMIETADKEAS